MANVVRFTLRKVTAKEVSGFMKTIKLNPEEGIDRYADLLAKTVVEAPIEGDLTDPETYLNLPYYADEDENIITYNMMIDAFNEMLEKNQKSTKSV